MIRGRFFGALTAAALAAALVAGCSGGGSASTSGSDTIKIGELVARSGPLASSGVPIDEGMNYAINEANAAGGVGGHKLELVSRDYQSQAKLVTPLARDLIANKVVVIGGLESGTVATSIEPVAEGAKVPVVTGAGQQPTNPWNFATFPTSGYYENQASFLVARKHTELCSLVIPGVNAQTQEDLVYPVFKQSGLTVKQVVTFNLDATDLTPQMSVVRNAGCNALYVGASGTGVVLAAQAAANLGMKDLLIVTHGGNANTGNTTALKDNASFVYFAVPTATVADQLPASDPHKAQVTTFFDGFKKAFGHNPDPEAVIGYTIGTTIIAGLKAGHTTPQSFRDWIATATVDTPLGTYTRTAKDQNGANSRGYFQVARWDPATSAFQLDIASSNS